MASVSLNFVREFASQATPFNITQGTDAPAAGAVELRIDLATNITKEEVVLGLRKLETYLLTEGTLGGLGTVPKF